jgi:hypothetical protein
MLILSALMNWKYKQFLQERIFADEPHVVLEAARRFMTESLGWQTRDSSEGFAAEGFSFSHQAKASIKVQPAAGGTRLTIDLQVRRAGSAGFMLFDVGGYYNIQIRKWLDGIQWIIHQKQTGGQEQSPIPPMPPANKTTACLFNGCLGFIVAMFGLYVVVTFICAVVGLITGNLYLWGRGGTLLVQGLPGRIMSALILLFGAFVVWRMRRKRK